MEKIWLGRADRAARKTLLGRRIGYREMDCMITELRYGLEKEQWIVGDG